MLELAEIRCQRGHIDHATIPVIVTLGGPTGYGDLPSIPERFARSFTMEVFDWKGYDSDGPYCPGRDAVSETIAELGIWEPSETILTLAVCAAYPASVVVDFGAQLGWFTLLACSSGNSVVAVEADPENVRVLRTSLLRNGWEGKVLLIQRRVGPNWPPLGELGDVALAKIDVEGAERDALRALWPSIEAGKVAHLMVEVTPSFGPGYPDLVCDLIDAGYLAFELPAKRTPPAILEELPRDLMPGYLNDLPRDVLRKTVEGWDQRNIWFVREDARW